MSQSQKSDWIAAVDALIKENEEDDPNFYRDPTLLVPPSPNPDIVTTLEEQPRRVRPPKRKNLGSLFAFAGSGKEPQGETIERLTKGITLLMAQDFYYLSRLKRGEIPIPWKELDDDTVVMFKAAVRAYVTGKYTGMVFEPNVEPTQLFEVIGEAEL